MKIVKFADRLQYNEKRAIVVLSELEQRMKHRHGVFNKIVLPQDLYPIPKNTKHAAHWLTFLALPQRGPLRAEELSHALYRLYRINPRLFDPLFVVSEFSEISLKKLFEDCALKYKAGELAQHWMTNSRVIVKKWGGDIRNAYQGVEDFEEFYSKIDYDQQPDSEGIHGVRRKIASLLTIFLQEKGLIPNFATPTPIDFHAMRIFIGTGIISPNFKAFVPKKHQVRQRFLVGLPTIRTSERDIEELHVQILGTVKREGLDHRLINPALWTLGRELCGRHFQTRSTRVKEGLDPQLAKKRRHTPNRLVEASSLTPDPLWIDDEFELITPEELAEKTTAWPKGYKDYCQHCPIENHCETVVPSGTYYDDGLLIKLPRIPYPGSRIPTEQEKEWLVRTPLLPFKTGARAIAEASRALGNSPEQGGLFTPKAKKAKR